VPKFLLFIIALFWTLIVLYFCLENSSNLPVIQVENLDKWIHSFFHFVFTLVWFLFFRKQYQFQSILKLLIFAFLFSFFLGILIELLQQTFTTTRKADIFDVIANSVGSLLGILVITIGNKFNFFNRILKS